MLVERISACAWRTRFLVDVFRQRNAGNALKKVRKERTAVVHLLAEHFHADVGGRVIHIDKDQHPLQHFLPVQRMFLRGERVGGQAGNLIEKLVRIAQHAIGARLRALPAIQNELHTGHQRTRHAAMQNGRFLRNAQAVHDGLRISTVVGEPLQNPGILRIGIIMVLHIGEQEEKIALAQANRAPFQLDIAVSANDQYRLVIWQYPGGR